MEKYAKNNKNKTSTFNNLLSERAKSVFYSNSLSIKEYILTYCLHYLREAFGHDYVSRRYEYYIDEILSGVYQYILHSPKKVLLWQRLNKGSHHDIANYVYWQGLSPSEQCDLAQHIVIQKETCYQHLGFFDLRMIDDTDALAINRVCGAVSICVANHGRSLSPEDVALVITKWWCKQGKEASFSFDNAYPFIDQDVDILIHKKKSKRKKQIHHIVDRMSLTVLLNCIKNGDINAFRHYQSSQDVNTKKPARKKIPDIARIAYSTLIKRRVSTEGIEELLSKPKREQRLFLKWLMVSHDKGRKDTSRLVEINLKAHNAPILDDDAAWLSNELNKKMVEITSLSEKEIVDQCRPLRLRINKIKHISDKDREMLFALACRRFISRLSLGAKNPMSAELIETYLNLQQAGVTQKRLRTFLFAVYSPYLSRMRIEKAPSRATHDFIFQKEMILHRFAKKWMPHSQHHKAINKIIALFTSEVSGAQCHFNNAFKHWHLLSKLPGKEKRTLNHFSNLRELNAALLIDPKSEESLSQILNNKNITEIPTEDVIRYARHSHETKRFLNRVRHMIKSPATKVPYPSGKNRVSIASNDLFVDIFPNHDAIGHLGASVKGVCIPYGGKEHQTHYSDATANLIVRDNNNIFLWGLLVKVQEEGDLYFLNNLQGALPTRYARRKEDIRLLVREALGMFGDTVTLTFFFNAICVVDPELDTKYKLAFTLPKMRLDLRSDNISEEDLPPDLKGGQYIACNQGDCGTPFYLMSKS